MVANNPPHLLSVGLEIKGGATTTAAPSTSTTSAAASSFGTLMAEAARRVGCSFAISPLLKLSNIINPIPSNGDPFDPEHMALSITDDMSFHIVSLSSSLNLCSTDTSVRAAAEVLLKQECQFASFLGAHVLLFPTPFPLFDCNSADSAAFSSVTAATANYARCVNGALDKMPFAHIWVRIPVGLMSVDNSTTTTTTTTNTEAAWAVWNLIRTLCDHNPRLKVGKVLEINRDTNTLLTEWDAEPVSAIILPTSTFTPNRQGFPVLTKSHQAIVRRFMRHKLQIVVSTEASDDLVGGVENEFPLPSAAGARMDTASYIHYLHHLHATQPQLSDADRYTDGYTDYLQAPLQPLMDHLESSTYEVFEQDPVKYRQYEQAVYRALMDRGTSSSGTTTATTTDISPTVIMVVGAGRGPLVQNCLNAAKSANNHPVKVYAVEKNPSALVVLRHKNATIWGGKVEIVHSDMRYYEAPELADILVSELLGSFGDNELSPECLDGAQKFLKKETGISIPAAYTSFIAPYSTSKLHHEIQSTSEIGGNSKSSSMSATVWKPWETGYVVKVSRGRELDTSQPLFTFEHPNRGSEMEPRAGMPMFNLHNNRYDVKTFEVQGEDAVMHGFVGYFHATLYKDVCISIHPPTHSEGMFSWFPIFFPIRIPIHLPKQSKVDIHVWRLTDSTKVWYEWSVVPHLPPTGSGGGGSAVVGGASTIHNPNGRSQWIGLF